MVADIATVFHFPPWAPRDLDQVSVSELMAWRERAAERLPKRPKGKG